MTDARSDPGPGQPTAGQEKPGYAVPLVLLVVLILAVVAGLAGTVWQWREAQHQRLRAEEALREAEQLRQREEAARALVEANLRLASESTEQFLREVEGDALASKPEDPPVPKDKWNEALREYEQLVTDKGADPTAKGEVAEAYLKIGEIRERLGAGGEALRAYQRAQRICAEELAGDNRLGVLVRFNLAKAGRGIALLELQAGRHAAALRSVQQALDVVEKLPRGRPSDSYNRACLLALQGTLIGLGKKGLTYEEVCQQRRAAAEAVSYLGGAVHNGFKDIDRLKNDKALDLVRSRADFRAVVERAEEQARDKAP
jgi:tetratricopeptide (TPR) repeat protein